MRGRDLTTIQWARLLDAGSHLKIVTGDRVAEGKLRSVGRREVVLDYPPGTHDGFPLGISRRRVRRVWRREGRAWLRVRSRRRPPQRHGEGRDG